MDNTDIRALQNEIRLARNEIAQLSSRIRDMESERRSDARNLNTRLTILDISIRGLSSSFIGDNRIPIIGLISTYFSVLFLVVFTVTHGG